MPNPPAKLHYEAALILESFDKVDLMIKELNQYFQQKPRDFKANMLLSGVYITRKMPEEAIWLLRRVSGNIEDHARWNQGMAEAYFLMGDYQQSMYHMRKVLEERSLDPKIHFNMGQIYFQRNNYEKALEHFGLALRMEPDNTDILYYLGTISREKEDFSRARYYYEKLLESDSGHVTALTNMGVLAIRRGDTASAESYYLKALASDSTDPTANSNLGGIYMSTGRKVRAEKHFKLLMLRQPDNFQAHLGLALICLDNPERWTEALERLRTAAQLSPEKAEYLEQTFIIPLQKKLDSRASVP